MKYLLLLFTLFFSAFIQAEMVDTFQFQNEANRIRAVALAKSLRCPQCQNQNLVESNSPIAYDLRLEVYKMVDEGKSNQAIIELMTSRFGDFVNYQPPFRWNTLLLWFAPVGLFLLAVVILYLSQGDKKLRSVQAEPQTVFNEVAIEKVLINSELSKTKLTGNWKIYCLLATLILVIALGYYFSLERFNQVKAGMQAQIEQNKQQVSTPIAQKNEQTISNIQQKLRQNPNDSALWLQLGQAYMQHNQFDNALIAYSNVEQIEGSQAYILGLAATALYYQAGQQITPYIQYLLDNALTQEPQEIASLSLLATEALKHKNYPQAKQYWQQILDSGNDSISRREIIQRIKMAEFLEQK